MAAHLEEEFSPNLHVFTDASVSRVKISETAAPTIPALGYEWSGRFSFVTSSTITERAPICLTLQNLPLLTPLPLGKRLILIDSRAVLPAFKNEEQESVLVCVVTYLFRGG